MPDILGHYTNEQMAHIYRRGKKFLEGEKVSQPVADLMRASPDKIVATPKELSDCLGTIPVEHPQLFADGRRFFLHGLFEPLILAHDESKASAWKVQSKPHTVARAYELALGFFRVGEYFGEKVKDWRKLPENHDERTHSMADLGFIDAAYRNFAHRVCQASNVIYIATSKSVITPKKKI